MNLRPLRPERSALAKLSYSPIPARLAGRLGKLPSLLEKTRGGKAGFACRFRRFLPSSCRSRPQSLRFQPLAGSLRLTQAITLSAARTAWPRCVRYLTILTGKHSGTNFPLDPCETLMGRGTDCHISLTDPLCSRVHAIIRCVEGERWVIDDQGSRNGTMVNGQKINDAMLGDGNQIKLWQQRVRVPPLR